MNRPSVRLVVASLIGILALDGCSPAARQRKLLGRADDYFNRGQYDDAEVEYLAAVHRDPKSAHALKRLAEIYLSQGRIARAAAYFAAVKTLAPDDLELRDQIGFFDLAANRQTDARTEALFVLNHAPSDKEAPVLLAEASTLPAQISDCRRRFEALPPAFRQQASVLTAEALLDFRENHSASGKTLLNQALAADPKYAQAYAVAGRFHLQQHDTEAARLDFKKAMELSPERSINLLIYARFEIQTGHVDDARKILTSAETRTPDFVPAITLLAELDDQEKEYAAGLAEIERVLQREPTSSGALLLKGQLLLDSGSAGSAAATLERAHTLYADSPQIDYQLARAYLVSGSIEKAAAVLEAALITAPDFPEAEFLLGEIKVRTGDWTRAIALLKDLIQKQPTLYTPRLLLAQAYVGQRDFGDALPVFHQLLAQFPKAPQLWTQAGEAELQSGHAEQARSDFEQALAIQPDTGSALVSWVALEVADHQLPQARQKVEAALRAHPKSASLYYILARILVAQKETVPAQAALEQAIALAPNVPASYLLLAELYATSNRVPQALAELQRDVASNPNDTKSWMLLAILDQREQRAGAAIAAYEKILALDPKFVPALNNLAWLYAASAETLPQALVLAKRARALEPNDADVADTLGWVAFREHQYVWALSLIQECAERRPSDPEVEFHLGMVLSMIGQEDSGRAALSRALGSTEPFPDRSEASKRLSILSIDPVKAGPADRSTLEQIVHDHPDDPVAMSKLAAIYDLSGDTEKAISTVRTALSGDPKNVRLLLQLARMQSKLGRIPDALTTAKLARNFSRNDSEVAATLGHLAFLNHNFSWSVSLLQEAAAAQPGNPTISFDLSQALYSIGKLQPAAAAARLSLADPGFATRADAKRFLEFLTYSDASRAEASQAEIDHALSANPQYVPALFAEEKISFARGEAAAAKSYCSKILSIYPEFSPAIRDLAIVCASSADGSPDAVSAAANARKAFPDDPEVAKACGMVSYHHGDFARAASLLSQSIASRPTDAEACFYLGMARYRLKVASSKQTLEQALRLDLPKDLARQAQAALAQLK